MRGRGRLWLTAIVFLCLLGVGVIYRNAGADAQGDQAAYASSVYEEFLAGERSAGDVTVADIMEEAAASDHYGRMDYLIYDVSGDGVPELHIQTKGVYYILAYRHGELFVWLTEPLSGNGRMRYEVLENGEILCRRVKSFGEYYTCVQIQPSGDIYAKACFGVNDVNDNEVFDNEDKYVYEDRRPGEPFNEDSDMPAVTLEEWQEKTADALYIDENGSVQIVGKQDWYITYASCSNEDMDLPYVGEEGFAVLRAAYDIIDFSGEFLTGDPAVCDIYKEKFLGLLHNEVPFTDPETGDEIYLSDFDGLGYDPEKGYDAGAYEYWFFDIDEDGAPELGIKGYWYNHGTYYFKYDPAADQFLLWYHMAGSWEMWFGSRKIANPWGGGQYVSFAQIGQDGEWEYKTDGYIVYYSEKETLYMVMLPQYAERQKEPVVTEEMKKQGVYVRSADRWYFRLTKEQFDQLMGAYYEAYERAEEGMASVKYTYEELFGH